jgi:hypothetical protein
MNDESLDLDRTDAMLLADEISDERLEAAARRDEKPWGLPCTSGPFLAPTFGAGKC